MPRSRTHNAAEQVRPENYARRSAKNYHNLKQPVSAALCLYKSSPNVINNLGRGVELLFSPCFIEHFVLLCRT